MAHEHAHEPQTAEARASAQPRLPYGDSRRAKESRTLKLSLALLLAFMAAEVAVAIIASSMALLADAAHMLTDAAALALALLASHLASRPAKGAMTFGLGRAEILSAHANGMTLLVLALLIVYGAISHLIAPPDVEGAPVLVVALAGVAVNLAATRMLGGHHAHTHEHAGRSLNVEGSYQHLLTDLFGFTMTAIAALVILLTGFHRADAIASLLIAAIMLWAAYRLLKASMRVMMEAAPAGVQPEAVGRRLASQPGVSEVHDLHVWEVTSGFPAVSAHIVVDAGRDCHELRRLLTRLLASEFGLDHSTLQVEHARPAQQPLQIEVAGSSEE